MPTWRCPNCHTVQSETPRCFMCGRSATSCGTCANFRSSFVGGLGYCGLDRHRSALTGAEQRPCWTGALASAAEGLFEGPQLPIAEPKKQTLSAAPVISARQPTS